MIQVAILAILIFVLVFGIGFIVNMLLKTTWLPLYLYILFVIGMILWYWRQEDTSLWTTISGFAFPDYAMMVSGFAGGWLTGSAIKTLRVKGYKMF